MGFTVGLGVVLGSIGADVQRELAPLPILAYMLVLIGFADDVWHLSAPLKFVLFAGISIIGALVGGVVDTLPVTASAALSLPFAVALGGTALWVFTLINCVNFMDGANGLALGAAAIGLGALGVIAWFDAIPAVIIASACCASAICGFLAWNFPGGRLFAGDSGALFVGALGAFGALVLVSRGAISPFVPPIVFFPLLADVLLTLLWRARRGRSLLEPHTEHLYQIAMRAWNGHTPVALVYWAAMAACGAIGFFVSQDPNPASAWIALAALAALSVVISVSVRSWATARGHIVP